MLPTRLARHGTLLTADGRLNLTNARFATDADPPDPACGCSTCARWSRGYLRHLLQVSEPTAARLLTVHNVAWTLDLVRRMRAAISNGTFDSLRREVLAVWG
jgi:queuine tRNA-ribosyltransferase